MFDHEEPIEYGVVLGEKLVERNVERDRKVDLAEQARKEEAAAWRRAVLIRFTPNLFGS